jgi:hypothetical protein
MKRMISAHQYPMELGVNDGDVKLHGKERALLGAKVKRLNANTTPWVYVLRLS